MAPLIQTETMSKLNDTHLVPLAHAGQRPSGSIRPLSSSMEGDATGDRPAKAIEQLISRGSIAQRETAGPTEVSRTDADIRYGEFITPLGLAAIGLVSEVEQAPAPGTTPVLNRETKASKLLALLQCDGGATLAELIWGQVFPFRTRRVP
jgi:hypothetical protein